MDELIGYSTSDFSRSGAGLTLGFDQFNVQGFSYDFSSRVPMLNFELGQPEGAANGPWVLTEVRERPQTDDKRLQDRPSERPLRLGQDLAVLGRDRQRYKQYDFATTSLRLVNGESLGEQHQRLQGPAGGAALQLQPASVTLPTDGLQRAGRQFAHLPDAQRLCKRPMRLASTATPRCSRSRPPATWATTPRFGRRTSAASMRGRIQDRAVRQAVPRQPGRPHCAD